MYSEGTARDLKTLIDQLGVQQHKKFLTTKKKTKKKKKKKSSRNDEARRKIGEKIEQTDDGLKISFMYNLARVGRYVSINSVQILSKNPCFHEIVVPRR
jgi:hypothetical protein